MDLENMNNEILDEDIEIDDGTSNKSLISEKWKNASKASNM